MAIKPQHHITKDDFEAALSYRLLSVSEVARETGIPRHILSQFRNHGSGMKPEQLAKLRDYLEELGVEFTDEETTTQDETNHFHLSRNIPDEVIREAMYMMETNDARLVLLLQAKLEHNDGLFGNGELTDETKATLQETFALLAGNYITFRMLRGWPALNVKPSTDKPETVRDMVMQTFMQPLIEAGLIAAPGTAEETEEEEETE